MILFKLFILEGEYYIDTHTQEKDSQVLWMMLSSVTKTFHVIQKSPDLAFNTYVQSKATLAKCQIALKLYNLIYYKQFTFVKTSDYSYTPDRTK